MTTQSTGVAVRENTPIAKLEANLANGAEKFKMALPSHISPEKFQRTIMTAAQTNPSLLTADRQSLLVAAMKAAQDGLLPDGREAALVPFSTSQKDAQGKWIKVAQVQYMPMAYGVRKKILQSGEISNLQTGVVYRREFEAGAFLYEIGLANPIRHRPMLDLTADDVADENIVAAYSIANLKDGTVSVEVMRRVEIDKVRQQSQTGALGQTVKFGANAGKAIEAKGPWVDWFGEMARKTVMRRHSKTLPMSGDLIDVEERDDAIAAASAHMVLASAEPAEPLRLPDRDELDRQSVAEELNDEIPATFDKETGEVFETDARGMSEVSEEVARELDNAGSDDEAEAEPEAADETPAWFAKVQEIYGSINAAKNVTHLKAVDGQFTMLRAGLPDDVIAEIEALLTAKRNALTKAAE